jgi:hypothetical protein
MGELVDAVGAGLMGSGGRWAPATARGGRAPATARGGRAPATARGLLAAAVTAWKRTPTAGAGEATNRDWPTLLSLACLGAAAVSRLETSMLC